MREYSLADLDDWRLGKTRKGLQTMTLDDVRAKMQAIVDEYHKEYKATEQKLMDRIAALGDEVKAAGLDPVAVGHEIAPILFAYEKSMIETIKGG